jgi:hypothetical protein
MAGPGPDYLSCRARLPEELLALVCLRLDPAALGRLECCSRGLRQAIQVQREVRHLSLQGSGVWRRWAEEANRAEPYPFISGMLQYVGQRQIEDPRAFKVILGSRRLLEATVETYHRELLPSAEFKLQPILDIRKILRDKSVQQLKALSRRHLMMGETEFPVMSEHRALFHSVFHPLNLEVARGLRQVKAVIEKLSFVNQLKTSA